MRKFSKYVEGEVEMDFKAGNRHKKVTHIV